MPVLLPPHLHRNERAVLDALPYERDKGVPEWELSRKARVKIRDMPKTTNRLMWRRLVVRHTEPGKGVCYFLKWPEGFKHQDPVRYKEMNE